MESSLAAAIISDNYGEMNSTLEGMHDTMGIVTQNMKATKASSGECTATEDIGNKSTRKKREEKQEKMRRNLTAEEKMLTPFRGTPFASKLNYALHLDSQIE